VTLWTPSVRPDELRPLDFAVKVPVGASITNVDFSMYALSDNTKSDVSGSKVAASGVVGARVRLGFQALDIGTKYHVTVRAELDSNETVVVAWIVPCRKTQRKLIPIQRLDRKSYWLDFSSKLPIGVPIDSATFTGYEIAAPGTNLIDDIMAGYGKSGQVLQMDFENCEAWKTYAIDVNAKTEIDPVTDIPYHVGTTLVLPCKEL
jgi:hypothetical protein